MPAVDFLVHSQSSKMTASCSLSRDAAGWEWMSFFVPRLVPGQAYASRSQNEEAAIALLNGKCFAHWGTGKQVIGEREVIFRWLAQVDVV